MSEVQTNILDLPDEILLIIFEYLHTEDKVHAGFTCLRFDRLLASPELVRSLNFAAKYVIKNEIFCSFFKNKERCEKVTELDITSCYWLKHREIISILRKLKHLNSLYAADTALDLGQAVSLVDALPKLKQFSCSWCSFSPNSNIKLRKWISSLEFLYLHLHTVVPLNNITNALQCCNNLEELWLVWTVAEGENSGMGNGLQDIRNIILPQLNKLVVLLPPLHGSYHDPYLFASELFKNLTRLPRSWKYYAVSENLVRPEVSGIDINDFTEVESLFGISVNEINGGASNKKFNKLKFYGACITEDLLNPECLMNVIQLNLFLYPQKDTDKIMELPSKLKQFSLYYCARTQQPRLWSVLSNLDVLDVTQCILKSDQPTSTTSSTSSETYAAKRCRIGFTPDDTIVPALETLTSSCSQLKELYLRACSCCEDYECVQYISRWKYLEKLSLEQLSMPIAPYLNQIVSSCSNLRSLNLVNLDIPSVFRYRNALNVALPKLEKLQDFRLEHLYIGKMNDILMTLSRCPSIQRVSFIESLNSIALQQEAIVSVRTLQCFLEQKPCFIFLYISSPNNTKKGCKTIIDLVKLRYAEKSPALTVVFDIPNMAQIKNCNRIPAIHFTEMVYPKKYIPNVPFYRKRYISHYI